MEYAVEFTYNYSGGIIMLAKVNELNRNVVILLSVCIIAITAIVVTLIATTEHEGKSDPLADIQQFQRHFASKYGAKPSINVVVLPDTSKSKTEALAEDISKDLNLGDVSEDDNLDGWYNAESKNKDITLSVVSSGK
jgi:hypothetical protein